LAFLAATITSNVVMVLGLRFKATGVIAANVIANVFACGLGLVLASQSLRGSFSGPLARALIRTGVSLLPGTFSFLLLAGVDRILLTQFVSPADLGLYAIANKLASMLYVLLGPAWNAWWPMALEMAPQPDAPRQYARMSEYFVAGSMLLALGLGLFAPEILGVFTRAAYVPAAPYALALMIYVGPLSFMAQFLFTGLYARKRTHLVSLAYLVAAAVNITLNILLNPLIGVWGAVWATVWAGVVLLAIAYAAGQRALPIPYRWRRIAGLSAVYLGLVTAYLLWPALNTLSFKLGAGLLLAAAIPAVGIVSRQQVQIALQALRYRMVHRA
ncbi:MAG: lipopolysaccharide biosynthesis protein, partial [Anaerolineales bacterium]